MEPKTIILGVVIVIVIYLLYVYYFSDSTSTTLVNMHDATTERIVSANALPGGTTSDYTYSIWLYINSWDYKYGLQKVIFERKDQNGAVAPQVVLDQAVNNLTVNIATYKPSGSDKTPSTHSCVLENIPIQRWANIIVTINNRALDLYLDGKLVRTCVLPGVPMVNPGTPITLCPSGQGFSGYTSNFQYYARTVNPREAYEIYRQGYGGGSWLGDLFNKYRVKLAFMKGNKEINSFQI